MRTNSICFLLVFVIPSGLFAQSCSDTSNLIQNPSATLPVGIDGFTHTTFAFVDSSGNAMTPDSQTAAALTAAVSEWNAQKTTTGAMFDALPPGQDTSTASLQIQLTDDATGKTLGCAAYSSDAGRIYYGQTFQSAVSADINATIFAHELGHTLGLTEGGTTPNPPSIMNNPSNQLPYACTNPAVPTTTVQSNDASTVPRCTSAAKTAINKALQRAKQTQTTNNNQTVVYSAPCTYTYFWEEDFNSMGTLIFESIWLAGSTCTQ